MDFLKSKQMPNISTGIGLMAQYKPALDHFLKNNVIQLLFGKIPYKSHLFTRIKRDQINF